MLLTGCAKDELLPPAGETEILHKHAAQESYHDDDAEADSRPLRSDDALENDGITDDEDDEDDNDRQVKR